MDILSRKKVFLVFGTRPEAIKLAPVIRALEARNFDTRTVLFRQHDKMLDEALNAFKIKPTYDLGIIFSDKVLFGSGINIFKRLINLARGGFGFLKFLKLLKREKPDMLLVQGDTSTVFLAALVAFYFKIPVGHVEAGLRTHNKLSPFPEEINRQLVARLADLHFAPTEDARANLLREGVDPKTIHVTGNTAIDAILAIIKSHEMDEVRRKKVVDYLRIKHGVDLNSSKKLVVLTAHRRESFGKPLRDILGAVRDVAEAHPEAQIIYAVHPNPNVRSAVKEVLGNNSSVHLTEPIAFEPFTALLSRAHFVLTDSGGIQEEASVLGKPVLVMRDHTERPAANTKLVGRERENIVREARALLTSEEHYVALAKTHITFGDGHAAEKIADTIKIYLEKN